MNKRLSRDNLTNLVKNIIIQNGTDLPAAIYSIIEQVKLPVKSNRRKESEHFDIGLLSFNKRTGQINFTGSGVDLYYYRRNEAKPRFYWFDRKKVLNRSLETHKIQTCYGDRFFIHNNEEIVTKPGRFRVLKDEFLRKFRSGKRALIPF